MGHLVGLPSLLVLVSATLLAIGLTLLRQAVRGGRLPGCGGGDAGCGAVTRGRWARLGPVPVALPGAAVYVALLASAVGVHPAVRAALPDKLAAAAWAVLLTAAFAAAGAGLWLAALQAAVIRRFCAYCMTAHGLAVVAAVLAAATAGAAGVGRAGVADAGGWPAGGPVAWAGALVAAFAVGQCLVRPKLYAVTPAAPADDDSTLVSEGSESVDFGSRGREPARPDRQARGLPPAATTLNRRDALEPPPARASAVIPSPGVPGSSARQVTLAGGNVTLAAADWPTLGPPDAPHLLALLADPTCQACRQMHRTAADAVLLAGGWLAVLYVPVPMDPACNPAAAGRKARTRSDVCDYARLVLAVHAAAPAAYPTFERWLLDQPDPPPPVGQARRRASELAPELAAGGRVGSAGPGRSADALSAAVDAKVAVAVAAYRAARLTQVPALLLPAAAVGGQLPSPQKLLDLLGRELGKTAVATAVQDASTVLAPTPLIATAKPSPARGGGGNPFAGGAAIGRRPPNGS